MTLAIIANAVLGLFLASVVITLLGTAIARSHAARRPALVAHDRHTRDHHRSAARSRTGWAARPDAS